MTTATDLIERLRDEGDLCKNDGANDIASLLWEAANALSQASALPAAPVSPSEREQYVRIINDAWMALPQEVRKRYAGDATEYHPLIAACKALAAPAAQQPAVEPVDRTFALMLLSEASKSGHLGTMKLAAQLAGVPACEGCGYVVQHCRCASPTAQPAAPDVVADARRWQPIETAPKDRGVRFVGLTTLGRAVTAEPAYCVYENGPEFRGYHEVERGSYRFIHLKAWMPFPPYAIDAELPAEGQQKP